MALKKKETSVVTPKPVAPEPIGGGLYVWPAIHFTKAGHRSKLQPKPKQIRETVRKRPVTALPKW